MKSDELKKEERQRHEHCNSKDHGHLHHGPKTFRRRRAITFLEMMNLKRATIKQQLEEPEFESIKPILVGELKAFDLMINEFIDLFEIHGTKEVKTLHSKTE